MATSKRNFTQAFERIGHNEMEHLAQHGYAIVDGFLGTEWSMSLRNEIQWLMDQKLMFPNQVWWGDSVRLHVYTYRER